VLPGLTAAYDDEIINGVRLLLKPDLDRRNVRVESRYGCLCRSAANRNPPIA
jgi:hypothetical protein